MIKKEVDKIWKLEFTIKKLHELSTIFLFEMTIFKISVLKLHLLKILKKVDDKALSIDVFRWGLPREMFTPFLEVYILSYK